MITDEAQCKAAAATAGKKWWGSEFVPTEPRGCYWSEYNFFVYVNPHPTGGANPDCKPLCAVLAATGATSVCVVW